MTFHTIQKYSAAFIIIEQGIRCSISTQCVDKQYNVKSDRAHDDLRTRNSNIPWNQQDINLLTRGCSDVKEISERLETEQKNISDVVTK